jgi:hypothetical protein
MSASCASNAIYFFCHATFKECKQVGDGPEGEVWLPSLLCRSQCEIHAAAWNECLAVLEEDADQKLAFEFQMQQLSKIVTQGANVMMRDLKDESGYQVQLRSGPDGQMAPFSLSSCDAPGGNPDVISGEDSALSFALGQYPGPESFSVSFPLGMSTADLYPKEFSTFTSAEEGATFNVPCFVPGEFIAQVVDCPNPFVANPDTQSPRGCVKQCPSPAFSDREYTVMWSVKSTVGILGIICNVMMLLTWAIQSRKVVNAVPFQIKSCVIWGLLYGLIETIPSVALKYELPCSDCETEECTGQSLVCAVNRTGMYILLGNLRALL